MEMSSEANQNQESSSDTTTPTNAPPHRSSSLGSLSEKMAQTTMNGEEASAAVLDGGNNNEIMIDDGKSFTLIAKYGKKEKIVLDDLPSDTTIGEVKEMILEQTRILPKRQKLVGLVAIEGGSKGVTDDLTLDQLKVKNAKKLIETNESGLEVITHQFILMGTPEEHIFIDPQERDDLPDVVDDFELNFNAGSAEWMQHVANGENLKKFTEKTPVHIMNPPRPNKPLLVLDLDHTLLDFSSKTLQRDSERTVGQGLAAIMKRPYMDQFLADCYQYYDIVVWSQTSWRWLETKLIELGMVTNPGYKICFVLDKTSMFTVTSTKKRDGVSITHHVKPLQIIWSKFPDRWGSHNTVHVDDLSRNFALNLGSGLKIKAYYRKKASARRDAELLGLGRYLVELAKSQINFDAVNFNKWADVAAGKTPLLDEATKEALEHLPANQKTSDANNNNSNKDSDDTQNNDNK